MSTQTWTLGSLSSLFSRALARTPVAEELVCAPLRHHPTRCLEVGGLIKELAVAPKQGPYAREYLEKEVSEDFAVCIFLFLTKGPLQGFQVCQAGT